MTTHSIDMESKSKSNNIATLTSDVHLEPVFSVALPELEQVNSKLDEVKKQTSRRGREEGNFTLGCLKLFHTRTRFIMVILVLFCLASVWSNILAFNFAVLCMYPSNFTEEDIENASLNGTEVLQHMHQTPFTPRQRTYLTSAVAAAALIANFPLVSIVNQFGIRTVFTLLGLLSAFATCLFPTATNLGFTYLLGARILQGIAFAANFPVIGEFTSKWTYYKQNGLFVSLLVAYVQLAPAMTMSSSGILCSSSWGWPSVYYTHGIISFTLFSMFGIFYRNSPSKHPFVSEAEKSKIAVGKTGCTKEEISHIPYSNILKTASVWAVWLAALGNFTCVNVLFLYSPTYLHRSLGFQMSETGLAAAIPPLLQFVIKLFSGFTSDKIKCISETGKLRLYNSIAFLGCGTFLVILAFIPISGRYLSVLCLGAGAGILGFTTGGFFKAAPLVSKHYSAFVTGNVSLGITLTMLVVPFMVTNLAPNNTLLGWRTVWITTAGVLAIADLIFCLMCSADPAPWTTDEFSREASKLRLAAKASRSQIVPELSMG